MNRHVCGVVAFAGVALAGMTATAGVVWNEGVNGDLSGNQALPTGISLNAGVNSVVGLVGGTDTQDWLTFTVPAGFQLTSLALGAYASNDAQGFMGVQAGSSFVGNPFTAAPYMGYGHFGTGAVNGALPPTNLIGADMLAIMSDPTLAPGSQGFTAPLGAGTYTLLIQQLGAGTEYRFDFTLVPGPSGLALGAMGCFGLVRRSRRG